MPMFQLRAVLEAIVVDAEERKNIVDMVENDLRATGYPTEQVTAFLTDLLTTALPKPTAREGTILTTRKLRSPFAMGFEAVSSPPADAVPEAPEAATAKTPTKTLRGVTMGPGFLQHSFATAAPAPLASATASMPPPPPDAPPAPPKPPAAPVPGSGPQRRASFIFEGPIKPPAPPPAPPPPPPRPSKPDMLMPAGTKSLLRHEIFFGAQVGMSATMTKPLILIADDDKRARMVFRLRIEEAGFTTVECGTGDEAWERIQQGGVALAVLDMKMPGLHGLEVLANIADKCPGLPVVICSAYDQLQDEFVVRSYPRLKYLVKPLAPEKLVGAIKELLAAPATPQKA